MKELYISNQDRYHGIILFLRTAARYWENHKDDQSKAQEGRSYLESIKDQRPRGRGPFEMEVEDTISKYAQDSAKGVDFMMWEVDDAYPDERGDMNRAQRTLSNL